MYAKELGYANLILELIGYFRFPATGVCYLSSFSYVIFPFF